MKMIADKVHRARKVAVPIIGISCYDPAQTIKKINEKHQHKDDSGKFTFDMDAPLICKWDIANGLVGMSLQMDKQLNELAGPELKLSVNPEKFLGICHKLPAKSIVYMLNSQRVIIQSDDKRKWDVNQHIWNLRDKFKNTGSTLILLGTSMKLPDELKHDIYVLEEELPNDQELEIIVNKTIHAAIKNGIESSNFDNIIPKAIAELKGLTAYEAEQSVALAMYKEGLKIEDIRERKIKTINAIDGLQVYSGKETFKDIGGCDAVKEKLLRVANGKDAPRVIVFMDEGEKMFAGATSSHVGDSGVSKDALGVTLSFMEDNDCTGTIFVGPPGAAKSAVGKAFGNEIGVPTIMLDFGAIKAGVVGESERKIREAYKIIKSIGGDNVFFIMTCNKEVTFPPELKRRFTTGTFFFDLPNEEEGALIWSYYLKKYENRDDTEPGEVPYYNSSYKNWTGAEIRNVCRTSYRENINIKEAAEYIIPIAISAREEIDALRKAANGRWLSANYKGAYKLEVKENDERKFDFE